MDNVSGTINHVSGTTKRSQPRDKAYWGQGDYAIVTLHLDPRVHKLLKIMAIREETPLLQLVNEALTAWVAWLAKADRDESMNKETAEREFREAADLLYWIRQEKRMKSRAIRMNVINQEKMEKAMKSRRSWHRMYPGKLWPGVGKQAEWFKGKIGRKVDHVPETGKGDLMG